MSTNKSEIAPRHVPPRRPGPVGGKRDQNRRQRTQQLCEAGIALFLEHGIEAVTIDDIVKQAGIAKGSFYRYFKDKADLVDALFSPMADELRAALDECETALRAARDHQAFVDAYETMAARIARQILENGKAAQLYLQESRGPAAGARKPVRLLADLLTDRGAVLAEVARDHGLARDFDPRVSALAVIGAVEKLLFGVLSGQDVGDATQIPDMLISLVLDGLRAK